MTYDEIETKRLDLIHKLQLKEVELYKKRGHTLPPKSSTFSDELARRTEMQFRTAELQAEVDSTKAELGVLADRAQYLIATESSCGDVGRVSQ